MNQEKLKQLETSFAIMEDSALKFGGREVKFHCNFVEGQLRGLVTELAKIKEQESQKEQANEDQKDVIKDIQTKD